MAVSGCKAAPWLPLCPKDFPELRCKWLSAAAKEQLAPGRGVSDPRPEETQGESSSDEQRECQAGH